MLNTSCRILLVSIALLVLLPGCAAGGSGKYGLEDRTASSGFIHEWNFDTDPVGGLPEATEVFSGDWAVRAEADAPTGPNALCQTATAEFPGMSLGSEVYADVVASTGFKPISGQTDQAAGIIFRVQDRDNYYILRANALEDNVNFYRYVGGKRELLAEGAADVAAGQWQELRLEVTGNQMRGYLNGQPIVEASDSAFQAGKMGLWTKADSVTCFDQVVARVP